jgi:hypothetical protein
VSERDRAGIREVLSGFVRRIVEFVGQIVEWIITVVFRRPGPCAEMPKRPFGYGPNPDRCNDFVVTALDAAGGLMVYPGRPLPETLVKEQNGIKGFDGASRFESTFPPSAHVIVRAAHFGQPARIEAFESNGQLAGMQTMAPPPAVEQDFTFTGSSLRRVVVTTMGDTIVIDLCH